MTERRIIALRLSYFTVGYNVLEGVVSVVFALLSGSTALLGFGVDSFVESLSGMFMIWRFSCASCHPNEAAEQRERIAIRLVGLSLVVLAVYVIYESCSILYLSEPPERSPAGLLIALVSLIVMPVLLILKRRTAASLKSRSLATDAKQTLACILLSVRFYWVAACIIWPASGRQIP
jgi:divalent metal cation (Fe/Co/Zn/Cd) transporter